jgi:hypothetical protein
MDPASELRATISELDKGQKRIAGLTTLNNTYGSRNSNSSRSSSRPGSSAAAAAAAAAASTAAAAAAGSSSSADVEQDAPYGSPVLTPAQQKLAAKLKRAEVAKPNYTIRLIASLLARHLLARTLACVLGAHTMATGCRYECCLPCSKLRQAGQQPTLMF